MLRKLGVTLSIQGPLQLRLQAKCQFHLHLLLVGFHCWSLGRVDTAANIAPTGAQGVKATPTTRVGIADTNVIDMRIRWKRSAMQKTLDRFEHDEESSAAPVATGESEIESYEQDLQSAVQSEPSDQGWNLVDDNGDVSADIFGLGNQDLFSLEHGAMPSFNVEDQPLLSSPVRERKKPRLLVEDVADCRQASEHASSSGTNAIRVPEHVLNEAFRSLDAKVVKYPWERGPLSRFFNPVQLGEGVPKIKPRPDSFLQVQLEVGSGCAMEAKLAVEPPQISATLYTKAVKAIQGTSYVIERDARRVLAINGWVELLMLDLSASDAGVTAMQECGRSGVQTYLGDILDASFGLKSPNTLLKRFYSVKMFSH